jgi:hypothetical protein
MIFLSRASPSIRDSALTQILSSVKARFDFILYLLKF